MWEFMALTYIALTPVFSLMRLLGWIQVSNVIQKSAVLMMGENLFCHPGFDNLLLELVLNYPTTIILEVDLVRNISILIFGTLVIIYFDERHGATDAWNLVKQLAKNVIYKGTPLAFAVPKIRGQAGLWLTWLIVVCTLKMFEALARDRLQWLNASPSTTPLNYFGVYCLLLLIVTVDALWIRMCLLIYQMAPSSLLLLLFFEPLSIAFKTLQGILVHGFQLVDIWLNHSAGNFTNSKMSKLLDMLDAVSEWKWKYAILRNVSFSLDIMTLLMAFGHYVQIWHAFHHAFPIGC